MRSRDAALGVGLTVGALLVGCGEEAPIGTPSPTAAAVDGPERGEAGGANDPLEAVDRLMRENRYPEATLAIAEALARTTDPADRERSPVRETAQYCLSCGAHVPTGCPACGCEEGTSGAFCSACGAHRRRFRFFRSFLAEHRRRVFDPCRRDRG